MFNHNPTVILSGSDLLTCESLASTESLWQAEVAAEGSERNGFKCWDSWHQRSVNCWATQRNHQNNDHFSLPPPSLVQRKEPLIASWTTHKWVIDCDCNSAERQRKSLKRILLRKCLKHRRCCIELTTHRTLLGRTENGLVYIRSAVKANFHCRWYQCGQGRCIFLSGKGVRERKRGKKME